MIVMVCGEYVFGGFDDDGEYVVWCVVVVG